MGFLIYYLALIVNPMSRILVRSKSFVINRDSVPPYLRSAVLEFSIFDENDEKLRHF